VFAQNRNVVVFFKRNNLGNPCRRRQKMLSYALIGFRRWLPAPLFPCDERQEPFMQHPQNTTIIGLQWGDEGKGKMVDRLAENADMIVRFQGGHNAGHTLVVEGITYKLNLLPSGIVRPDKKTALGHGVVLDLWALEKEMATLSAAGIAITPQRFMIAENTSLIMPWHRVQDQNRESGLGDKKIGTTGRGIGPAYEDRVGRRAFRAGDLLDPQDLKNRLVEFSDQVEDFSAFCDDMMRFAKTLSPHIVPLWHVLSEGQRKGEKVLFEGAQGFYLDVDFGTYPFVTSSNTLASQAATGTGLPASAVGHVLGVVKAYTTRVGSGPFPTELGDATGEHLGAKGHEFGTVTGRKRRCGWLDGVLLKQACTINGIHALALTKLDVLDELPTINVAVAYQKAGVTYTHLPLHWRDFSDVSVIYETLPGWQSVTEGLQDYNALPANAKAYIAYIERLAGVPVTYISTGPEREATIVR
jgi:adenylosuccinate synthase